MFNLYDIYPPQTSARHAQTPSRQRPQYLAYWRPLGEKAIDKYLDIYFTVFNLYYIYPPQTSRRHAQTLSRRPQSRRPPNFFGPGIWQSRYLEEVQTCYYIADIKFFKKLFNRSFLSKKKYAKKRKSRQNKNLCQNSVNALKWPFGDILVWKWTINTNFYTLCVKILLVICVVCWKIAPVVTNIMSVTLGEGHLSQRWRIWDPMGPHNNFFQKKIHQSKS